MGHHIDKDGRFQSDKYPDLPPDKVVLSLSDPTALRALLAAARAYLDEDVEFATDLGQRLVDLHDDVVEVTLEHHDGGGGVEPGTRARGWLWWETEYPEEGSCGPYVSREDAYADMPPEAVVTTYKP